MDSLGEFWAAERPGGLGTSGASAAERVGKVGPGIKKRRRKNEARRIVQVSTEPIKREGPGGLRRRRPRGRSPRRRRVGSAAHTEAERPARPATLVGPERAPDSGGGRASPPGAPGTPGAKGNQSEAGRGWDAPGTPRREAGAPEPIAAAPSASTAALLLSARRARLQGIFGDITWPFRVAIVSQPSHIRIPIRGNYPEKTSKTR